MKIIKLIFVIFFAAIILLPSRCCALEVAVPKLEPGDYTIIGNERIRIEVSELLLTNEVKENFVVKDLSGKDVKYPLLFPNSLVDSVEKKSPAPAVSFYRANERVLADNKNSSKNISLETWKDADDFFRASAGAIAVLKKTTGPISYIFFDGIDKENGQEDGVEILLAMPDEGYYGAFIKALLGDDAVNLAGRNRIVNPGLFNGEAIDGKTLIKDRTVIIVPSEEASLGFKAHNYHVVVFKDNAPVPASIKAMAQSTAAEIQNMLAKKDSKVDEASKVEGVKAGLDEKVKKYKKDSKNEPQQK